MQLRPELRYWLNGLPCPACLLVESTADLEDGSALAQVVELVEGGTVPHASARANDGTARLRAVLLFLAQQHGEWAGEGGREGGRRRCGEQDETQPTSSTTTAAAAAAFITHVTAHRPPPTAHLTIRLGCTAAECTAVECGGAHEREGEGRHQRRRRRRRRRW